MTDQIVTIPDTTTTTLTGVLAELVGPDKKFKSVEDLAIGKNQSDLFITKLQDENKDLRSLLEQATNNNDRTALLEKLMTDLNSNQNQDSTTNNQQQPLTDNQAQSLSRDDIVRLIEEREQARKAQANYQQAIGEVAKVHGENTDTYLSTKATELGLTVETLKALAQSSPKAFLNTIGHSTQAPRSQSMSGSGVNSQAVFGSQGQESGIRNKAYYDKLQSTMEKDKKGSFILNKSLQVQLHKDMVSLGDEWDR